MQVEIMNRGIILCKAKPEDFEEMLNIEREHFSDYERMLSIGDFTKWHSHNKDMFFVVKKASVNQVLGFLIIVPIKETLYKKIANGLASDIFDFNQEEVEEIFYSDYFFLQQVCVTKKANTRARVMLIGACFRLIYENGGKFTLTSPITEEGKKVVSNVGFRPLTQAEYNGKKQEIYWLKTEYNKFAKYAKLAGFHI